MLCYEPDYVTGKIPFELPNLHTLIVLIGDKFRFRHMQPKPKDEKGCRVDGDNFKGKWRSLAPAILPNLLRLEITLYERGHCTVLSFMWDCVPYLEEVEFQDAKHLRHLAFIGPKNDCPFLLLGSALLSKRFVKISFLI